MKINATCMLCGSMILALSIAGCKPQSGPADAAAKTTSQPVSNAATDSALPDSAWIAVVPTTLHRLAPAIGTLRSPQAARIGPQVSGRVAEVLVDVGDRVTKGQVVVRLDPALFQIDVQQQAAAADGARGALASTESDVTYWQQEFARQQDLFERGAGSQKELDDARAAYERAVGNRDENLGKFREAENKRAYAQQRLDETEIRAPYDGVVSERMIDPGDMASSGPVTELIEIREVDTLFLEFSLPQELLGEVRPGTPLEFQVEGIPGGPWPAAVEVVFPTVDVATRSFRCRAVIPNQDNHLLPGVLARVRVEVKKIVDALAVPRAALVQTADGWQVFVPNDGHPKPRKVEVGMMTDEQVQILSGLTAGERILASADLAR